ncbi:hypothetical protein NUU61_003798 [Penicillium alfredii]|uniref:Uncharacterized protein n=1 Tax=Penicillium alfredii TaxID=1506179 RepID=A0A9W9FJX5_9EURO|nr:uncharacterized protein NUU61_003798 [Penicillium alfredii]KAJ5101576.1 hypothetical protein NUU61_003798 [Penicillium alfredii]
MIVSPQSIIVITWLEPMGGLKATRPVPSHWETTFCYHNFHKRKSNHSLNGCYITIKNAGATIKNDQTRGNRYGFFSTYQHNVFLKQERVNDRWTLFYSAVIQDMPTESAMGLTVRQCFFFLGVAGSQALPESNSTPDTLWWKDVTKS